jgi:cobalt-precorrin 5A hydrolase / cobalt-factor III methyltransferase / precorrin-3B C17-methyltransferase
VNVLSISLTEAGKALAERLPYEHHHGDLAAVVRDRWDEVDAFVLVAATGIAVRMVGPLLGDKATDPAVVCVDDTGRHVVALCGGHAGGANALATDVAALLGAEPVISTATDARGAIALDALPGFVARGDVAAVTRAWLDGAAPSVDNRLGWPLPFAAGAGGSVIVTDQALADEDGRVVLHPPSLVVGVGASSDAPADAARELLDRALHEHGLARESIALVATIDRRAGDPVVTSLGLPVRAFDGPALAGVEVPNPSERVAAEVGTASVAEAAALLAAGPGATLVVTKQVGTTATLAIARRARPEGSVAVVGLGPGSAAHRTPAATAAVRHAQVVVGFDRYIDQCAELLSPAQTIVCSPIGAEVDRCRDALARARDGASVALVCSGDAGVFAMATLVLELAPQYGLPPVEVVPGVTAATAAAGLLGAPLAHDHAFISLSDLLTPWPVIEQRLRAVAESDMAVALYNPRSLRRTWQLEKACALLLEHRPPTTPVGICTDVGREDEHVVRTTLGELDPSLVGMLSIVLIGSSTSTVVNDRIVTPRGYHA